MQAVGGSGILGDAVGLPVVAKVELDRLRARAEIGAEAQRRRLSGSIAAGGDGTRKGADLSDRAVGNAIEGRAELHLGRAGGVGAVGVIWHDDRDGPVIRGTGGGLIPVQVD